MKTFATKFAHNFDETAGHFSWTSSRCSLDFIIAGCWDYFFAAWSLRPTRALGLGLCIPLGLEYGLTNEEFPSSAA
jgi:hypothetical protein